MKIKKPINDTQVSIFSLLEPEAPPQPGSMDISMRLRHAISDAIKKSGKDRIDICAEIYKLSGKEVPKSTLDGWSAESRDLSNDGLDFNGNKRWGISADVLAAFCCVTGDWEALFIIVEACNYKALKGKDVVRARIGLLKEEITKKNQELKGLEKALVESE
ncbi:putative cytosolic protein [Smithella sp. ME-1]|uniref:Phage protein n=1 Tax=hydrocarbon metagenome TaxID=938273 RepID=A0A0W8FNP8_9ZZZZ|nr:putative cytosolic protein [Smithella sp. ME-1]